MEVFHLKTDRQSELHIYKRALKTGNTFSMFQVQQTFSSSNSCFSQLSFHRTEKTAAKKRIVANTVDSFTRRKKQGSFFGMIGLTIKSSRRARAKNIHIHQKNKR